jgi:uncharacterized membrane protein YgdD (TMEM256/DUF423 family)
MPQIIKTFLLLGASNAAMAVLLGAFGAHLLKARLSPEMLAVFQTGLHYHLFHSLGLLAVALVGMHVSDSVYLKWSGWLMVLGIVLFSGSLYGLSISGLRGLGMLTPFGGLSFIAAWVMLVLAIKSA